MSDSTIIFSYNNVSELHTFRKKQMLCLEMYLSRHISMQITKITTMTHIYWTFVNNSLAFSCYWVKVRFSLYLAVFNKTEIEDTDILMYKTNLPV